MMWKLNYATGITVFLSVVLLLDKERCRAQQIDQYIVVTQPQQNGLADKQGGPGSNTGTGDAMQGLMQMAQQNSQADNQGGPGSNTGTGDAMQGLMQMAQQNSQADNQGGPGSNTGTGSGMPGWMQLANQFMSSWMNSNTARSQTAANNGTAQTGGFFASLMDGISSFTSDMAARARNSTSSVSPRFQRIQNRTSNWFNNWRNNMNGFFF